MSKIKSIALVDDDEIFVFLTKMTIEDSNLVEDVKVFRNGSEVLTFFNENLNDPRQLPEVILLDIFMPIMDGWQFLEEYLVLKPHINKKIIIYLVSSSISPQDHQKAKKINEVANFIIKPVTRKNLLEILKNL